MPARSGRRPTPRELPCTFVCTVGYRRRKPENESLYQVLAEHLETFLEQTRNADHRLPRHVEDELRAYLECGILSYGFVRARCEDCGESRAVPFSCMRRGFCPSCLGRRMVASVRATKANRSARLKRNSRRTSCPVMSRSDRSPQRTG